MILATFYSLSTCFILNLVFIKFISLTTEAAIVFFDKSFNEYILSDSYQIKSKSFVRIDIAFYFMTLLCKYLLVTYDKHTPLVTYI